MKKRLSAISFCILIGMQMLVAQILVVPEPQMVTEGQGSFTFNDQTTVYVPDSRFEPAVADLYKYLRRSAEIKLHPVSKHKKKNTVELVYNADLPEEGYALDVTKDKVQLTASSQSGFFYGVQTLLQLLPTEIFSEKENDIREWSIPCVSIQDEPRFGYRGFMLDVSRHFVPKKDILKLLDYLALHKINTFHWHLIDDNGWRLEIKKYPLLTSIGAFRAERNNLFPLRANQIEGEPTPVGGFYTQDDVREIIAYASDRNIEVIPEIEMPAHTNASLAAYPHLACPVVKDFLGTIPGGGGKNASVIYCAGNDSVFAFLEDVVDEVVELFPSSYIHIGGDEAWKDNWKLCTLCQKRMEDNNIPNEEELQSYFIRRMNVYIQSKGKKLMGWDELVDSEIPEGATIFGWRGLGQSAVKAAKKGHSIVLTPAQRFYLIRYQGPQWFEPFTYFGNNTLKDVYDYDMRMSGISEDLQDKVLGYQASMWSEFVTGTSNLEYMLFPRLAAMADISWSKKPKDWEAFLKRLDKLTAIYEMKDINYARSMYNLFHDVQTQGDNSTITVSCLRPDVEIRYTIDGTVPDIHSTLYTQAVSVKPYTVFQALTFCNGKPKGQILKLIPIRNLATGTKISGTEKGVHKLVNGILGSEKFTDGEYLDVYAKDLAFTVELGQLEKISEISLGFVLNGGMGAHYPQSVQIEYSKDGKEYHLLKQKAFDENIRFVDCIKKDLVTLNDFDPVEAKFIKVQLGTPGIVPASMPREGQPSRIAIDEVYIN